MVSRGSAALLVALSWCFGDDASCLALPAAARGWYSTDVHRAGHIVALTYSHLMLDQQGLYHWYHPPAPDLEVRVAHFVNTSSISYFLLVWCCAFFFSVTQFGYNELI